MKLGSNVLTLPLPLAPGKAGFQSRLIFPKCRIALERCELEILLKSQLIIEFCLQATREFDSSPTDQREEDNTSWCKWTDDGRYLHPELVRLQNLFLASQEVSIRKPTGPRADQFQTV